MQYVGFNNLNNIDTNVTINTLTNTFTIQPHNTLAPFTIVDGDSIEEYNTNGEYGVARYRSINDVIGNFLAKNISNTWTSGYVNFHTIRNIYMRWSSLGTYSTTSLRGDRDIIKKIPVSANANEVVFNNVMVAQGYLDCNRLTLSRLRFKLEDVDGNLVGLNRADWSFSIIFAKFDTEL